ncbi:MAG: alpha-glucosidase C-terminal domain-containing protein [Ferruginibacter sp.]
MALTCVVNGMPLLYSGQEAGLNRSLKFFDKDTITWQPHPFSDMYKKLFAFKHDHQALWNGGWGGQMIRIFNDRQDHVLSFSREKNGDKVVAIFNFDDSPVKVKLNSKYQAGTYTDLFSGNTFVLKGNDQVSLSAWGYLLLSHGTAK